MKYYKLISANGSSGFAVEQEEGLLADLTSVDENLSGLEVIARAASLSGVSIDKIAERIIESGQPQILKMEEVLDEKSDMRLARPFDPPEVWGAGATYNKDLSKASESYIKIYQAERPMLFFKATPQRCVGPFESVGIREDSAINIPEPELAFVLYQGEIIGYTVANDMSAVSIEGENTYYQPQAKVYNQSCAIGPCFVTAESIQTPEDLDLRCSTRRDNEAVWHGESSTSHLARSCAQLADWIQRSNSMPDLTTVLTGCDCHPPSGFTLQQGDVISITIEGIGTLENTVIVV
jgi:2-dehydro-3-deoxy-D-arabinonate dehydratase